jgi:3-phenylpropionate/trans-cinnamate dioxygenase ferredoxin reductase subunit
VTRAGSGVLVVGTGQAGIQLAVSLREEGYDRPITLIGDETPVRRPPLSKGFLKNTEAEESLRPKAPGYFAAHDIELVQGTRATAIEREARRVRTTAGSSHDYEHLVLATGVRNRALDVPGCGLDGVLSLRTLADARLIRDRIGDARNVVIAGAGFIGLEVATVARELGAEVTVVERGARPMMRAVSQGTAAHLHGLHVRAGTGFRFSSGIASLTGRRRRVAQVTLADGEVLPADLVLVAIGVVPVTELASACGLPVAGGIVVDALLATPDPAVSAIGDCAAYPSAHADGTVVRLESVQNAVDQARCLAARLTGRPRRYESLPWFWSDQAGTRLQIAGLTSGHDHTVVRGDPASGAFSTFCYAGDRLLGVESINRPADHIRVRRLLEARVPLLPGQAADPDLDLRAHPVSAA